MESTRVGVSFLIKLQTAGCKFIKKVTPRDVLSCEISEIIPEQYFYRTPLNGCFFLVLIYSININLVEVCSKFSE